MTKRFAPQTARNTISLRLRRRLKKSVFFFKKFDCFGKCVAKSTGSLFDPETVPSVKIQYLSFPWLIFFAPPPYYYS